MLFNFSNEQNFSRGDFWATVIHNSRERESQKVFTVPFVQRRPGTRVEHERSVERREGLKAGRNEIFTPPHGDIPRHSSMEANW